MTLDITPVESDGAQLPISNPAPSEQALFQGQGHCLRMGTLLDPGGVQGVVAWPQEGGG